MKPIIYGHKKTGRIVGILYIIGTVAGILSARFLSVRNAPDYLEQIAGDPGFLLIGTLFTLVMGFSLAMIPVVVFPVLKKHSEAAGIGYIIFRGGLETCCYIISIVCTLALARLGAAYSPGAPDAKQLLGAGVALKALTDSSINAFVFGAGALVFYTTLYRFNLLPRWIMGFGIVAILLHIASGVLVMFGLQQNFDIGSMIMNLPIAVQEMLMAVWMIIKGFRVVETKSNNGGDSDGTID